MGILEYNDIVYSEEQKNTLLDIAGYNVPELEINTELCIKGYAGTGKTTIALNIIKWAEDTFGVDPILLAPTNKAALVLKSKTGKEVNTMHSYLYGKPIEDEYGVLHWKASEGNAYRTLVMVDEASMISEDLYKDLINKCNSSLIIFLGDNFQLEPVDSNFNIFTRHTIKYYQLTEVKRQDNTILDYVTELRNKRYVFNPSETDDIKMLHSGNFVSTYCKERAVNPSAVILCATNKTRINYNLQVRAHLQLSESVICYGEPLISINNSIYANGEIFTFTDRGWKYVRSFFTSKFGEVYLYKCLRNAAENEFMYLLLLPFVDKPSVYHATLSKELDFDFTTGIFKLNEKGYAELDRNVVVATYGYTVSTHKSQGSQWSSVFVNQEYQSKLWDNARWLYTACTRAEKKLFIHL